MSHLSLPHDPAEVDPRQSTTSTLATNGVLPEKVVDDSASDRKSDSTKHPEDVIPEPSKEVSEEPSDEEYPSGIKMVFIVVALVLSVFLLSLDMVSLSQLSPLYLAQIQLTFNCNRPLSQPLFPRSQMSSRVSIRSAGTVLPSS